MNAKDRQILAREKEVLLITVHRKLRKEFVAETVFSFQGPRVEDVLNWDYLDHSNFFVCLPIRTS